MPLFPESLAAWSAATLYIDDLVLSVGDAAVPESLYPEAWLVAAAKGRVDLEQRLRQGRRTWRPAAVVVKGERMDAAVVTGLSRERAVKLGYKLHLPVVFRLVPGRVELAYCGR